MKIPYDMSVNLDSKLNETPNNLDSFGEGLTFLRKELSTSSGEKQAHLQSLLGAYLKTVGDFKASADLLDKSIEFYQSENDQKNIFIAQMRLAGTYLSSNEFMKANLLYQSLELKSKMTEDLKTIYPKVLEYVGRASFHQAHYPKALDYFKQASELSPNPNLNKSIELCLGEIQGN